MADPANMIITAAEAGSHDVVQIALPLVGTVIGALIAAGMSLLIARQNRKEARRLAREQRRDQERVATMRTTAKLLRLTNSLKGLKGHFERSQKAALQAGIKAEDPVTFVRALSIHETAFVSFDMDELTVFVAAKETKFLSRIIMLGDEYNSMMHAMREYSQARNDFLYKYPAVIVGGVGAPQLDAREALLAAPQFANLNALIGSIIAGVDETFEEATAIVAEYGPIVRTYFGDPKYPVLEPVEKAQADQPGEAAR